MLKNFEIVVKNLLKILRKFEKIYLKIEKIFYKNLGQLCKYTAVLKNFQYVLNEY